MLLRWIKSRFWLHKHWIAIFKCKAEIWRAVQNAGGGIVVKRKKTKRRRRLRG